MEIYLVTMIFEPHIYFNFHQPQHILPEMSYRISYFYCGKDLYRRIWDSHSGDAEYSMLLSHTSEDESLQDLDSISRL